MKSQARVVVIGGGIAGCSTLYHLTKEGWSDVVLVERNELTSGTTWHSAAQVTNFAVNQTMVGIKSHSIKLYRELADDLDYPVTYNYADGGIRLANSEATMDGYRHFASQAKAMGVEFEILDADECARRHPLIATDRLIGGLWDPHDGDIDPAQLCQALARRARKAGAEVYRNTPVTGLTQLQDDSWTVHTDQGDIACEIVVNACGYRVNEVAAMMGLNHPVVSMEHQYFLTEPIQQIVNFEKRVPLLRCPIDDFYSRQEKQGLLVGFYEQACKTWGLDGIDPKFVNALCPSDTDRVLPVLENVFRRMPVLREVGIHTIINGPITYTIDGAPLVGPVPGKRNAFCIVGLRAGIGEGGGHGWMLAQQIVHGEAAYDTWVIDPRRFTGHATVEYCALKAVEDYRNEFRFHFPHEHRPAGRPAKTTPITSVLAASKAAFGVVNGWERVVYVKPTLDFREVHSFRFNNVFSIVRDEVSSVHNGVGLTEISGFNRFEITGSGALDWLDKMICGPVTRGLGQIRLCYLLNEHGKIKSEATLARLDKDTVWYGSAAASEYHDMDWLVEHMPRDGSVSIRSLTNEYTTLLLAGPKSRAVLSAVARGDWSATGFPWLSVCHTVVGIAPATVIAVSYSGELSYEIHVPNAHLQSVYLDLLEAGQAHGIQLFGAYAVESMRLEKGYRHWKADLVTEFSPFESGLGRFVSLEKTEFVGKAALEQSSHRKTFVHLILDCAHAPAQGGDCILSRNRVVGSVTSAGWGHRIGKNIAFGFVDPEYATVGTGLEVEVIGRPVPAVVVPECLYDPENIRIRS